jgi:hypothetical protein
MSMQVSLKTEENPNLSSKGNRYSVLWHLVVLPMELFG